MAKNTNTPDVKHPARVQMEDAWRLCRDLAAGQDAVVAGRARYLPRHPGEHLDDFKLRLTFAELFNAFRRTISAGVGLLMQTPPKLPDDASEDFVSDWDNIDGRGTKGPVFAKRFTADAMVTGLGAILVDFPKVAAPELLSKADELARGLRPYWVHLRAEQIISWRFASIDGQSVLAQFVFRQEVEEPDGEFGVACVTYYRVFRRAVGRAYDDNGIEVDQIADVVEWQLWKETRQAGGRAKLERTDAGFLRGIDEIPIAVCVVGDDPDGFMCSPPLKDLADVNVSHYRLQTDRNYLLHLGCVPQPVRNMFPAADKEAGVTKVSASTVMDFDSKDGNFRWEEITGSAFEPSERDLKTKEQRMGALGLSFLAPDTRHAETAKAKQIDSTAQNATLTTVADAVESCLEGAERLHMKYRKQPDAVIGMAVNREYEKIAMDPVLVDTLSKMEQAGQLTIETLLQKLVEGHVLHPDFDITKEAAALEQKKQDDMKAAAEIAAKTPAPVPPGTKQPNPMAA
jgi:hypothetical protein